MNKLTFYNTNNVKNLLYTVKKLRETKNEPYPLINTKIL